MSRRTVLWALAAVAGIVLTAAITWATSQLTGQHIGISSEPISAGRKLAPAVAEHTAQSHTQSVSTVTRTVTRTAVAAPPTRTTTTVPQAPGLTESPSITRTVPETQARATPETTSTERATSQRTSGSSGDDGGNHRTEPDGAGRHSHARDD